MSTCTPEGAPLLVFGGTFDPVHLAHLRLAEEALAACAAASVRWIPAGWPPHRGTPRVAGEHRLQMVRLAIADNPRFQLDDAEVLSAAPSYTVDTLERLRAELGAQRPLILLLGADAFAGLAGWHRWPELFALAHLAVAERPGHALDSGGLPPAVGSELRARRADAATALQAAPAGRILPFAMTALDVAATRIRALLEAGASARYLLSPPVLDYIQTNRLYSRQVT